MRTRINIDETRQQVNVSTCRARQDSKFDASREKKAGERAIRDKPTRKHVVRDDTRDAQ